MRLKEALKQREFSMLNPSRRVKGVSQFLKQYYPILSFKKNQVIQLTSENELCPDYCNADLYSKRLKKIIQVDVGIDPSTQLRLTQSGYEYLDLSNVKNWEDNLTRFLDPIKIHFSANENELLGGKKATRSQIHTRTISNEIINEITPHTVTKLSESLDRDISDLIGKTPGWILRSGISAVALLTVLILCISHLIQYPDKITAPAIITTLNPPIPHLAKVNAVIDQILVENEAVVRQGEPIIYLKNTAIKSDVELFIRVINEYSDSDKYNFVKRHNVPSDLSLGDLQPLYALFQLRYKEYQEELNKTSFNAQIETLGNEIRSTYELIHIQAKEKSLFEEEVALSTRDNERNAALYDEGVISLFDLDQSILKETQLERQYEGMRKGMIQNQIKIDQLQLQSEKLKEERFNVIKNYQFQLNEIGAKVKETYAIWKDKFLVTSEISGQLNYSISLKNGISIKAGQILFYVVPEENNNAKILTAQVSSQSIGELKEGNKAIIKIEAHPHKQYGVIIAQIGSISQLPLIISGDDRLYEVTVPLTNELKTDYNKKIDFNPDMKSSVDFVSHDKSILERVMSQFLDLIRH